MATKEAIRDMPAKPQAPIDESVKIPESVKRAAAAADAFYNVPHAPEPPPEPAAAPAAPDEPLVASPAEPVVEPVAPAEPEGTPVDPAQWEHRYLSMKGRYESAQKTIGGLQEQMQQLGDELVRTQSFIQTRDTQTVQDPTRVAKHITEADEQTYGPELIDVARRAAQDAILPELNALKSQNAALQHTVAQTAQQGVYQALDREIPSWRAINSNPRFVSWLRLRDIYSGGVRHQMLNAAFRAADAPRVLAFFKGFVTDEATTGNLEPAPQSQPPASAPREPAVPLSSLAAPGRARPASGDSTVPADKPIFTRTQIQRFYEDVRKGAYAGREVEKDRQEREIFSAQNQGRVRG